MNLTEQNQVLDFLKKKKLSYPLFKEVYDHFSIEIDEQMKVEKGFQEAFLNTKVKWSEELKMINPDILSLKKVPKIEARMLGNRFKNITKFAGLIAMLTSLFILIYEPIAVFILFVFSLLLFGTFIYMFFKRKISLFEYIKLTFHPLILRGILVSIFLAIFLGFFAQNFGSSKVDLRWVIQCSVIAFNLVVQIQLLLLHNKKINVLVS